MVEWCQLNCDHRLRLTSVHLWNRVDIFILAMIGTITVTNNPLFGIRGPYPANRPRRMRRDTFTRDLIREHEIGCNMLIQPYFVIEGDGPCVPVPSMPGVERVTIKALVEQAKQVYKLGVPMIVLFPVTDDSAKTDDCAGAYHPDGLAQRAIHAVKQAVPELGVMTDIALDPYSPHGHDGLMDNNGYIVNDATVEVLVKQALSHAKAGADVLGPSDMMDGRIGSIRAALESEGHIHTLILSYAAKYASAFYGPFRDAVGASATLAGANKYTYQIDPANGDEAMHEIAADLREGADMIMVKPGLPYLDIVRRAKDVFSVPTYAYHVSGEYAMLKAASEAGWINERAMVMESMLAFRRAGCDGVLTYYAHSVAQWLQDSK